MRMFRDDWDGGRRLERLCNGQFSVLTDCGSICSRQVGGSGAVFRIQRSGAVGRRGGRGCRLRLQLVREWLGGMRGALEGWRSAVERSHDEWQGWEFHGGT